MLQVLVGRMLLANKRVTGARGEKCTMIGTGRLHWSAALALCLLVLPSGFAAADEHGNSYAIAATISVVSIAEGNNESPVIGAISNLLFSSQRRGPQTRTSHTTI